jgi:TRAP-type mannitol/chloroaromatic compound transport system substrate-binding protein
MDRWNELPEHLKTLMQVCMNDSQYHRQWWYWGGEAKLRVDGTDMKLTTIDDAEWAKVEEKAHVFWDEIAAQSPLKAKVVDIIRTYNANMAAAGRPYRFG